MAVEGELLVRWGCVLHKMTLRHVFIEIQMFHSGLTILVPTSKIPDTHTHTETVILKESPTIPAPSLGILLQSARSPLHGPQSVALLEPSTVMECHACSKSPLWPTTTVFGRFPPWPYFFVLQPRPHRHCRQRKHRKAGGAGLGWRHHWLLPDQSHLKERKAYSSWSLKAQSIGWAMWQEHIYLQQQEHEAAELPGSAVRMQGWCRLAFHHLLLFVPLA